MQNQSTEPTVITHGVVSIGLHQHRIAVRSFPRTGLAIAVHEASPIRRTVNQIVLNATAAELRELAAILTKAADAADSQP